MKTYGRKFLQKKLFQHSVFLIQQMKRGNNHTLLIYSMRMFHCRPSLSQMTRMTLLMKLTLLVRTMMVVMTVRLHRLMRPQRWEMVVMLMPRKLPLWLESHRIRLDSNLLGQKISIWLGINGS